MIRGDSENRLVRTFRPRRRRLGSEMLGVYERQLSRFALDESGPRIDLDAEFGRRAQRILEIGCGRGDLANEHALRFPNHDIVAVDVHTRGIANILATIERHGLDNLRVVEGDALVFLDRLDDSSFDEVWVFFPDPWVKPRQRARRLVRTDVVDRLVRIISPGGYLRTATDIEDYARQMRNVLSGCRWLDGVDESRPDWRTETVFERRGHDAGRGSVDLCARRNELRWRPESADV